MPIIIEAALSEPPSSVACFRDVTLYANCFINRNILLECSPDVQDIYWRWLKRHGAFDFVADLVAPFSERDFSIRTAYGSLTLSRIDASNLSFIRARLPSQRQRQVKINGEPFQPGIGSDQSP